LIFKILKTKEIICKIFKTLELWDLWSFGRHKPEAGGFCLDLLLIIHGVSSAGGDDHHLHGLRIAFGEVDHDPTHALRA
jgi:hypothetical protein